MILGYVARAIVQALSSYFIVSVVLSMAVWATWHIVARRPGPAGVTARRLFRLRLVPALGGLVTAMLVLLAYGRWEARVDAEGVGLVALAAAAGALGVVAAGLVRAAIAMRHTRRIRHALTQASAVALAAWPIPAQIVESRFPVVALVGLVATRLFVARRVVEACTTEEMDAVVAHEHAHAVAHDNLRRLALTAAPDVLGLVPAGRRMQEAWLASAELAADEWAARREPRRLALAAALVKVARLATSPAPPMPASTLFDGDPITTRVRRLLEPPPTPIVRRAPAWLRALAGLLLVAAGLIALPVLHAAAEQILKLGA